MATLYIFGALVIMPLKMLWDGYVIKSLWWWFVVPVFDLPALTVLQAAGANLVFVAFKGLKCPKDEDETAAEIVRDWLWAFISPAMLLGLGALLHAWRYLAMPWRSPSVPPTLRGGCECQPLPSGASLTTRVASREG